MPGTFGQEAEEYVARHVVTLGWKVLERNFHSRFGEVDLIASDGNEIVFVEVKARMSAAFGDPLESVTETKLHRIEMTAHTYLQRRGWEENPWRVDVFGVTKKDRSWVVDHLRNFG